MIGDHASLTIGHVKRHAPPGSGLAEAVAVMDIAQDFLLAHLHERGVFDLVTFKGGTALRKMFAGPAGRFSTDLDLAAVDLREDRQELAAVVASEAAVSLGPFCFHPHESRGRWRIAITSDLGDPDVSLKLDVGPPCWLAPFPRDFVALPTHQRCGFELPALPCQTPLAEVPPRLAGEVKEGLLKLVDDAVAGRWPHARACRLLGVADVRVHRWRSRLRDVGTLEDRAPGGNPVHRPLGWEIDAILELIETWGPTDRTHRKLAHRRSYLGIVYVAPSTVLRVAESADVTLPGEPARLRPQAPVLPEIPWEPNRIWIWDATHSPAADGTSTQSWTSCRATGSDG